MSIVGQAEGRQSHSVQSAGVLRRPSHQLFWTLVQLAQRRSLGFAEMEEESEFSTMCIARMSAANSVGP